MTNAEFEYLTSHRNRKNNLKLVTIAQQFAKLCRKASRDIKSRPVHKRTNADDSMAESLKEFAVRYKAVGKDLNRQARGR